MFPWRQQNKFIIQTMNCHLTGARTLRGPQNKTQLLLYERLLCGKEHAIDSDQGGNQRDRIEIEHAVPPYYFYEQLLDIRRRKLSQPSESCVIGYPTFTASSV